LPNEPQVNRVPTKSIKAIHNAAEKINLKASNLLKATKFQRASIRLTTIKIPKATDQNRLEYKTERKSYRSSRNVL
jgi:hypothetical protein